MWIMIVESPWNVTLIFLAAWCILLAIFLAILVSVAQRLRVLPRRAWW
jgi:hypothetical protein